MITLREQLARDKILIGQLSEAERALLDLELRQIFNPPGYSFKNNDLS